MENYFVLNEHGEPRVEPDVNVWLRWFEQADRNIARYGLLREGRET